MKKQVYHTASVAETEALAEKLAHSLKGGEVLAYTGGMGMGKTAFTRGLARGLGIRDSVSSPTFALIHEYRATFRCTTLICTGWKAGAIWIPPDISIM